MKVPFEETDEPDLVFERFEVEEPDLVLEERFDEEEIPVPTEIDFLLVLFVFTPKDSSSEIDERDSEVSLVSEVLEVLMEV